VSGSVQAPAELKLAPVRQQGGPAPHVRLVAVQVS